jgi:hypothetical protein
VDCTGVKHLAVERRDDWQMVCSSVGDVCEEGFALVGLERE